jgi:hypothetical protein
MNMLTEMNLKMKMKIMTKKPSGPDDASVTTEERLKRINEEAGDKVKHSRRNPISRRGRTGLRKLRAIIDPGTEIDVGLADPDGNVQQD